MFKKRPEEWLEMLHIALQEVLDELAKDTDLEYKLEACDDETLNKHIAMVELFSPNFKLHAGIATKEDGADFITSLLLGEDEEIDELLRADALGEMINITTGRIKRNLLDEGEGSDLGIPIVIEGRLIPISRHECHICTMNLLHHQIQVFVLVSPYA